MIIHNHNALRPHVSCEPSLFSHHRGLFAHAVALTRNSFEAEDLVQETYVRAIQAMGRLREGSNLRAWLHTILRNVHFNDARQKCNGPRVISLEEDDNHVDVAGSIDEDPHTLAVRTLETRQVQEAIQQLSDDYRTIILLREYKGFSYQQIAKCLRCPPGTVMSRLARARSRLGTLLASAMIRENSERE